MAPAGIGGSVEGVHPVAAALESGRVRRLFIERGRGDRGPVGDVVHRARADQVEVVSVDSIWDHAQTDAPQGVVAECEPIALVPFDDLLTPAAALLVLDHLEDPRNVGAIARTALAAGMTGLVVPERRAAPLSAVAFKAAAGALERLPVAMVSSVADCARRASQADVWTVGLAADGPDALFGLQLLTEPVAIFIGAEGAGLSKLLGERLDVIASIPMSAGTESLNASVAAALACFEVLRMRATA